MHAPLTQPLTQASLTLLLPLALSQSRVDAVLSPRPPREPLGLGDYLDALTTGDHPL